MMSVISKFFILFTVFSVSSSLFAEAVLQTTPEETALVEKSVIDREAKYRECLGWIIGMQSDVMHLGFTEAELQDVLKGFKAATVNEPAPANLREISEAMHDYCNKKSLAYAEKLKVQNAEIAAKEKSGNVAFFDDLKAKNKDNPQFKVLASGVCCEILSPGKSVLAGESDSVKVHYTGMLKDGTVFDSSYNAKEPAIFSLKGVIPGFAEGIRQIGESGRARIYIPSDQGYGNQGIPGVIPPGAMLVFEVELLEINPAVFDRVGGAVPSITDGKK